MFKETLLQKRQQRLDEDDSEGSDALDSAELGVEELVANEFAKEVSEKSGLSSSQVLKAMEREEKSSDELRQARNEGQVSVSQANEVIRLEREDQVKILPHIEGRTVSELRKLVKLAKTDGVEEAVRNSEQMPHAREFRDMIKLLKKSLKISQSLELEGISAQGKFKTDLEKIWPEFKKNMDSMLEVDTEYSSSFTPEYLNENNNNIEQESSFS
jgi:ParB family chromosome partitioning protein